MLQRAEWSTRRAWPGLKRQPGIRKELIERGADPIGNTPEQHAVFIKAEIEKWLRVAKQAGTNPE